MNNQREHITYLWQQFANKKATQAELDALFEYLNDPSTDETSLTFLQHQFAESVPGENLDKEYWLSKLKDIVHNDAVPLVSPAHGKGYQQPEVHRDHIMRRTWFRLAAAAVVLAVIATTAIVLLNNNKPDQSLTNNNKNLPGDVNAPSVSRAMITLADGRKVYLDSAGNGEIFTQNNTVVTKTTDGKIVYSREGSETQTGLVYNTLTNPRGSRVIDMTLADGSRVWLNAGSSVTYPVTFIGNERNVTMNGEAYFEIAHDASRPFKVSKTGMEVTVLGTHFNVNAYDDEKDIKVTLLEGSVKVSNQIGSNIIKPGEQSRVTINPVRPGHPGGNKPQIINSIDLEAVMAWKNGFFSFDRASLSQVLLQLSRWYDVDIVYEQGVPDINLGGEMKRDLSLSQVLKGLGKLGVNFRIEGKKLIVIKFAE